MEIEMDVPSIDLPSIIGYIHICQKGRWYKSFDMIMNAIKESGLYERTLEIRVGIVNDYNEIIMDSRFEDPKIKIVTYGPAHLYERVTLNHMIKFSINEETQYWYAHTKGIKYFDSDNLHSINCITDWIKIMIHFNFLEWEKATQSLLSFDTYGCEFQEPPVPHYSGNFWWANSQYIRTLPSEIGVEYCDPEFWLLRRENPDMDKPLMCNIFSSGIDGGNHYYCRFVKGEHYCIEQKEEKCDDTKLP
jgi:hypothetical protein